jgi:Family of unknown function (DUF6125)
VSDGERVRLDAESLERLRLGAITAIDGLWFLAAEKQLGFEEALELDMNVWCAYGLVMLRRLAKAAGVSIDPGDPPSLATVNDLLVELCRIDGTECDWEMTGEQESLFRVHRCSWWENLTRSGRSDLVPCEEVDNHTFRTWLAAVDPTLEMEIVSSFPRGDESCRWVIRKRAEPA